MRAALESFGPGRVALGLSPEEVQALRDHFSDPYVEPWVPLAASEVAYARGLTRYGRARVPSPAFLSSLRWGSEHGVPVEGIELPDDDYSAQFVEHIGYVDLLRRTLAERSLTDNLPEADDAEAFALAWDSRSQPGRGSRRLGEARASHAASRLEELCTSPVPPRTGPERGASLKSRFAVVVDVERFSPLLKALSSSRWKDLRTETPDPLVGAPGRAEEPERSP